MLAAKVNYQQNCYEQVEQVREAQRVQQLALLKKKKQQARIMWKDRFICISVAAIILALAFCFSLLEAAINLCGQEITDTKAQVADIHNQCDRLELEIEDLRSLSRIEEYATANLGMVYPEDGKVTYLRFEGLSVAEEGAAPELQALSGAQPAVASITVQKDTPVNDVLGGLSQMFGSYFASK